MNTTTRQKTVYVALALTHVKSDGEKDEIRAFLDWLQSQFGVKILTWAFDIDTWQPKPVDDVYLFDSQLVAAADLAIFLYLSSDGSDGRGGELVQRTIMRKPLIAFARDSVKMGRYPTDCLRSVGVEIVRFRNFSDMEKPIREALDSIREPHPEPYHT